MIYMTTHDINDNNLPGNLKCYHVESLKVDTGAPIGAVCPNLPPLPQSGCPAQPSHPSVFGPQCLLLAEEEAEALIQDMGE